MPAKSIVIYGATGFTGRLIVERAIARGLAPILAGRNAATTGALAAGHRLPFRVAAIDDPGSLRALLRGAGLLVNAAGPFRMTAAPLMDACIAAGVHYTDITGEVVALEAAVAKGPAAKRRRVMLLPAVGFDVLPSDCLAAQVHQRLPDATHLAIAFDAPYSLSRGSMRTAAGQVADGVRLRRDGRLVSEQGALFRRFDFGAGTRQATAITFGDVTTAFATTGVPNITTYLCAHPPVLLSVAAAPITSWLTSSGAGREWVDDLLAFIPEGPNARRRAAMSATIVAEVTNAAGRRVAM
ncbi:MAG: saccharopine dehydrogenase NADP-binding domain-containing protein, partial [Gemmatimonadota bacterium]|nr:saccharopine dehydrogenase NADP-binding domain-containing protein [Gemmatimonadota bacterium]